MHYDRHTHTRPPSVTAPNGYSTGSPPERPRAHQLGTERNICRWWRQIGCTRGEGGPHVVAQYQGSRPTSVQLLSLWGTGRLSAEEVTYYYPGNVATGNSSNSLRGVDPPRSSNTGTSCTLSKNDLLGCSNDRRTRTSEKRKNLRPLARARGPRRCTLHILAHKSGTGMCQVRKKTPTTPTPTTSTATPTQTPTEFARAAENRGGCFSEEHSTRQRQRRAQLRKETSGPTAETAYRRVVLSLHRGRLPWWGGLATAR